MTHSVPKPLADVLAANKNQLTEDGQDGVLQMGAEGSVNVTTEVCDFKSSRLFSSASEHSVWAAMKGSPG